MTNNYQIININSNQKDINEAIKSSLDFFENNFENAVVIVNHYSYTKQVQIENKYYEEEISRVSKVTINDIYYLKQLL